MLKKFASDVLAALRGSKSEANALRKLLRQGDSFNRELLTSDVGLTLL